MFAGSGAVRGSSSDDECLLQEQSTTTQTATFEHPPRASTPSPTPAPSQQQRQCCACSCHSHERATAPPPTRGRTRARVPNPLRTTSIAHTNSAHVVVSVTEDGDTSPSPSPALHRGYARAMGGSPTPGSPNLGTTPARSSSTSGLPLFLFPAPTNTTTPTANPPSHLRNGTSTLSSSNTSSGCSSSSTGGMFAGAAAGRVDVTSPAESFTIWDEAAEPEMPMDQRRQFLIELVMSLHGVGGTTHRTEHLISAVAEKLGVLADVIAFPNFALVSFLSPDGDPTKSELHHLPITGGLDLDKLGRIDAVCQDLLTDKLDPMRAWTAAAAIAHAAPCFPPWVQFLSYPVCGFSCALTFFGGGMLEAGIATLCAVLVGLLVLLGTRVPTLNRVMEFVCAFSVGFLTRVLTGADTNDACYLIIALSALVWFLPGLSITQAVMEISSRSMISGVARLVYAFSIALQLGFGMALGSELAWWASPLITTTCVPVNRLWHILTFFGVAGSFNVLLNANLRQWPGMTFASAVGLLISEFGASLDPNLITMLCALTVGLLGTALARYLNQNALTIILSGILMLVPGSVGLRGVTALLQQNTVSGVQFGFSMLLIALSIAIGLLVARLASNTPPLRPRLRGPSASPDARMSLVRLKDLPPI